MGSAFAERLLEEGFELTVHNRSPGPADEAGRRGADVAASIADLAAAVDLVLTSLPDDHAFEEVANAVIGSARPGTVLADLSTVSPDASARVASLAEAAGIEYLRAPVSGNPGVVRAGNVAF